MTQEKIKAADWTADQKDKAKRVADDFLNGKIKSI